MSMNVREETTTETGCCSEPAVSDGNCGAGALARLVATPPAKVKPASLRQAVYEGREGIRSYINSGGSWNDVVDALSQDLGRVVERRTVETYMADFYSAKAARKAAAASAFATASARGPERPLCAGDAEPKRHIRENHKPDDLGGADRTTSDRASEHGPRTTTLASNPFAPAPLPRRSSD